MAVRPHRAAPVHLTHLPPILPVHEFICVHAFSKTIKSSWRTYVEKMDQKCKGIIKSIPELK